MNETISRLVDDELDPHQREEVLEQIGHDDAARKSWKCYHLIGDVIRDEVSSTSVDTGTDLAALIKNKLAQEPTVLAPSLVKPPSSAKIDLWKPVGIFAVAASLVLVAVISLNPLNVLNKENASLVNRPISDTKSVDQLSREFDEMLIDHAEFSTSPGMSGLIVYARLVSGQLER